MSFFEKKFPYNLGGRQRHVETSECCRLNFIPKSALTESRWTYAVKSSLNEFLGKNIPELKYGSKHAKRDEGSDGKAFKWDGKNGAMGCRFIEFMILITYSNILQNTLCALFSISLSHFRAYSYEIHFILKDHFLKKVFFLYFFVFLFLDINWKIISQWIAFMLAQSLFWCHMKFYYYRFSSSYFCG